MPELIFSCFVFSKHHHDDALKGEGEGRRLKKTQRKEAKEKAAEYVCLGSPPRCRVFRSLQGLHHLHASADTAS